MTQLALFKISYFKFGGSLCADDFNTLWEKSTTINLNYLMSVSGLEKFHTPISDRFVGVYAVVKMSNGDVYNITEDSYKALSKCLDYVNSLKLPV